MRVRQLDNVYPGWIRGESDPKLVKIVDGSTITSTGSLVEGLAGNARSCRGLGNLRPSTKWASGLEQSPSDMDTIADLQKIPDILKSRGYSRSDIEGIMHGNWLRFFREAWKK